MRRSRKALQMTAVTLALSIVIGNISSLAGEWQQDAIGWKYKKDASAYAADWFQDVDGNWYFFGEGQYMQKGWYQDKDSKWYYFNDAGAMLRNTWLQDTNGAWYYLSDSGAMLVNSWFLNQDGKWYYFGQSGAMLAGIVTPDGYTLNADGTWNTDIPRKNVTSVYRSSGGSGGGGGGGSGGSSSSSGGSSSGDSSSEDEPIINPDGPGNNEDTNPKPDSDGGSSGSDEEQGGAEISTPSDAVEYYHYTISYKDIESNNVLTEMIGEAEKETTIEIDLMDIEGYEICDEQPESFKLNQDDMHINIYYQNVHIASPSEATEVEWEVRFVDAETHGITLSKPRTGKIEEGGILSINYMSRIVREKEVWEAVEPPPIELSIYGPGRTIHYVEYEQTGFLPDEDDPDKEAKELLERYLQEAKDYESLITGEEPDGISNMRFYVTDQSTNDTRVRTLAAQIEDTDEHVFYVIGKNWEPNGLAIPNFFGKEAVYSNLLEETIQIGETTYYVARMTVQRNYDPETCSHQWEISTEHPAGCLTKGTLEYECAKCGEIIETVLPALGHIDEDGDTVCDRCNKRTFEQQLGSELIASIGIEGNKERELTFVCIDDDYQGGMLYFSKESIPLREFGGYGDLDYERSGVRKYFHNGFQNAFSINGDPLMPISRADSMEDDYAMLLTKDEVEQYSGLIPSTEPFYTRTVSEDGSGLMLADGNGTFTVADPFTDDTHGVRIAVLLAKPDAGIPDKTHWSIGDLQAREIDGNLYMFECIDENYSDRVEYHRKSALFLCTSVIPADTGAEWIYEEQIDGSYDYTYKPGPIVNFGNSNDYKYSNVRKWLDKSEKNFYNTEDVNIGVDYAYMGNTQVGSYSQLNEEGVKPYYIGNQRLTGKVFILSVDEALKYKDYLWKFNSDTENPETQYGAFSKAYWLRNPMGVSAEFDETRQVYVVDLVNGNIHPQAIKPEGGSDDEEINVTGTVGVRPAFAMPNA